LFGKKYCAIRTKLKTRTHPSLMDNLSFFLIKFALKTFLFERVKRASLKVLANEFRKIN
jgi:hypothetical protein